MPTIQKITVHTDKGDLTLLPEDLEKCQVSLYQLGVGFPNTEAVGYFEFRKSLPPHHPITEVSLFVPEEALDKE